MNSCETPEALDTKYVQCEDCKDVEGFDTTEATVQDSKDVEEVLDIKYKTTSKK